jgi:hypothetical protein
MAGSAYTLPKLYVRRVVMVVVKCKGCGVNIYTYPSVNRVYCSRECKSLNINWGGGRPIDPTAKIHDPNYHTFRHWKLSYKLSEEDILRKIQEQNGVCPICKLPLVLFLDGKVQIYIDHDHSCCPKSKTCGKCVRGIIHIGCNIGLGAFKDNATICRNAAKYLENFNK